MKILGLMLNWFFSQNIMAGPSKEFTYNDAALKKLGRYTLSMPSSATRPKKPGFLIFFHGSGSTNSYTAGVSEP